MNVNPASALFTCSICAKSCSNKRSLIRHILYCKRARPHIRPRKKSCLICIRAKTRCDLAYPSCSRCMAKDLNCAYEKLRLSAELPILPLKSQSAYGSTVPEDPSVGLQSGQNTALDPASQIALREGTDHFHHQQSSPIDWAENLPFSPSYSILNLESEDPFPTYIESANNQPSKPYPWSSPLTSPVDLNRSVGFPDTGLINTSVVEPSTLIKAPISFRLRRARDNNSSLNSNYVLCTLRSYPHMMIEGKSLPPFIHSCLTDVHQDHRRVHEALPQSLAACAAIIQMFSAKTESNTVFIWRAIRMEQERISEECSQYDDWNAVAAFQAVTVYFLLRLSEVNEEATNFDFPLIYTMIKLVARIQGIIGRHSATPEGNTTWKSWMVAESLSRTIIVLFLVDLFYDIFSSVPNHHCDGVWILGMKLPCSRKLWHANTAVEWEMARSVGSCLGSSGSGHEGNAEHMSKGTHLTYGDLVNYRNRVSGALDEWLSCLDDFGTLVMAAASLYE